MEVVNRGPIEVSIQVFRGHIRPKPQFCPVPTDPVSFQLLHPRQIYKSVLTFVPLELDPAGPQPKPKPIGKRRVFTDSDSGSYPPPASDKPQNPTVQISQRCKSITLPLQWHFLLVPTLAGAHHKIFLNFFYSFNYINKAGGQLFKKNEVNYEQLNIRVYPFGWVG